MDYKWAALFFAGFLAATSSGFGSAFSIFENGARAAGMGGAFVALADDGSAIFFNPAGIAFQEGFRLEMDALGVVGLFRFFPSSTPPGTIVPEKGYNLNVSPHLIPVLNMYLSREIAPKWTFGFGAYAPFGLSANGTNFRDSDPGNTKYVGRFAGSRAALKSIWFQPTVAYQLTPNSSLGLGAAWVHTHLFIEQSILNPLDDGVVFGENLAEAVFPGLDPELAGRSIARLLPEGRFRVAGTSNKPGFSAGYLYKHPRTKTNVGFMWRSAVTHKLDGKASFAFTPDYALEPFIGEETIPELFPTQKVKGSFTTPATYSMGVSTRAFLNTTISAQFDIQDYQRFKSVPINFSETEDTATPDEVRLDFSFENSYIFRVGAERNLGDKTSIRVGYNFDHTGVQDKSVGPLFPDSSRHSFTGGVSRIFGNKEFTMFYMAMSMLNRQTNVAENNIVFTNGEYNNFVHLFGFGARFYLGADLNPFQKK